MSELEQTELTQVAASADQGAAWAEALYARGDVDDETRAQWLKAGAEVGIVPAMADYADYLEYNERLDEAETWYRAAADAGSADAMYACALIEDERGDHRAAEAFYRSSAERGFLPAIYDLGRILYQRDDPSWRLCYSICQAAGYVPWDEGFIGEPEKASAPTVAG